MSARPRRRVSLLNWLRVQRESNPQWVMTPERIVKAFERSGPKRKATTGEATVAVAELTREGVLSRFPLPSGWTWWFWRGRET